MSGPSRSGSSAADRMQDDAGRFRRPRRPLEVRRRAPWKRTLASAGRVTLVVAGVALAAGASLGAYWFATTGSLFRLSRPAAVGVGGNQHVPASTVRGRFAADLGRSIFYVPLEARRKALEEITWVERATVQRVLPDRVHVHLRERTPVAFLRRGASLWLIDAEGVILPPAESASYTFPVIIGLSEAFSPDERRARIGAYLDFIRELDEEEKNYSRRLSEVDVSDPENLRATVAESGGALWLLFGQDRFQEKFETYLEHRSLWQAEGEEVRAVDLRYRGQIILNPDPSGERDK